MVIHGHQGDMGVVLFRHQVKMLVVIGGHQRSSEVIRGHQRSSEVIRGHQRSSEVIRGHQRHQGKMFVEPIRSRPSRSSPPRYQWLLSAAGCRRSPPRYQWLLSAAGCIAPDRRFYAADAAAAAAAPAAAAAAAAAEAQAHAHARRWGARGDASIHDAIRDEVPN